MNEGRDVLIYLALVHDGNYHAIMKAVREKDYPSLRKINEEISSIKAKTITILDEDYPDYLKKGPYPPIVLFYYGDISLINYENQQKGLAIVGSRECSEYGEIITRQIVKEIGRDIVVVSGMARGIDSIAHRETIRRGGKTVAVLGSGIDNVYPIENVGLYHDIIRSGGLVISEYPNMSEPAAYHFPIRDRLIALLSKALVVTEAYGKSGTSHTVGFALEQGKDVMAVPYPYDSVDSFCNLLIYEGALLVRDGRDVKEILDKF